MLTPPTTSDATVAPPLAAPGDPTAGVPPPPGGEAGGHDAADDEEVAPTAGQRRLARATRTALWLTPWVLFILVAGVHLALSSGMRAPIIQADEFGYLADARWLAHAGPRPSMQYSPGYPLLLVPLWWASHDAGTVYRWALSVNAGLAGLTAVLLYRLSARFAPGSPAPVRVGATLVVAAFPSLLLYSNIAESENLLIPGFLAVCLLAWRAHEWPSSVFRWSLLGLVTGLLYCVHPRAVAVVLAVAVFALWRLRPWRGHSRPLAGALLGLLVGLGASAALGAWVTRVVPSEHLPTYASTATSVASHTLSGSGMALFGSGLAGEVFYLVVGSAGLVAAGAAALWWGRRRVAPGPVALLLGLSLAAMAALGAAALEGGTRVDTAVYGRYVEVVAVPVMLAGAVALASRSRHPGRRWRGAADAGAARPPRPWAALLLAVGALAAGAAGVAAYRGSDIRPGPGHPLQDTNTFALDHLFALTNDRLELWLFAGIGLAAVVAVVVAYRMWALAGVVVTVGAFVAATLPARADLVSESKGVEAGHVLPDTLNAVRARFGGPRCVAWDVANPDDFHFFDSRLYDAVPFVVFDSRQRGLPCGELVVSGRDLAARPGYGGARLVAYSHTGEGVWVTPGPLQDRMAAAGWLLPPGYPAPLPASAGKGSVRLVGPAPTVVGPSPATVTLEVANGGDAPWPDAAGVGPVPRFAVRVAVWWYRAADTARTAIVATGRADLSSTVLPGQRARVAAVLQALGPDGRRLPPGGYTVQLSLIQESVTNFDAGAPPVLLHVVVR
ncbi:MAG TPA: hypothetical protein VFH45_08020 [Acidimicrobiales bacterium]|nr:hypothetical protein [Acidimicrobiales bacterium]